MQLPPFEAVGCFPSYFCAGEHKLDTNGHKLEAQQQGRQVSLSGEDKLAASMLWMC